MISKNEIRMQLMDSIKMNKPVIGVAVGSGLFAKQAYKGGADLLLALSAGRYRASGVASLGCMLPFKNSNDLVFEFASVEILPKIKDRPVIFGACATDLTYSSEELFNKIIEQGFSGVNNFPTVGLIDGKYREALESSGLGYDEEVKFMKKAVEKGLFTIAFVFNEEQAEKMAKANVDVVCAHFGWTVGGEKGVKKSDSIYDCVKLANKIFKKVDSINKDIFKMIYGGPVDAPEQAYFFYENTKAIGYLGGSSFERIPTELAIYDITDKFKNYYKLKKQNEILKEELLRTAGYNELIGQSSVMRNMYKIISKVADKNINVFIQGESGTGKELVVRALYFNSKRHDGPFVKVNCAAIPNNLLESELFGHEKGAFTGADKRKLGKFELADKGTIFLDEIGEMDLNLQAKLLRVIQQKEFERVGGYETIKVDVRIVSATNINIQKAILEGRFRQDLYYRLNVVSINTPPLRDRKEDIPLLVNHFIKDINNRFGYSSKTVTTNILDIFMEYDWPGNVRELRHVLERAAVLSEGELIRTAVLPEYLKKFSRKKINSIVNKTLEPVKNNIKEMEKQIILKSLEETNWNRTESAKKLGITRRTLYNKMKVYNIKENWEKISQ